MRRVGIRDGEGNGEERLLGRSYTCFLFFSSSSNAWCIIPRGDGWRIYSVGIGKIETVLDTHIRATPGQGELGKEAFERGSRNLFSRNAWGRKHGAYARAIGWAFKHFKTLVIYCRRPERAREGSERNGMMGSGRSVLCFDYSSIEGQIAYIILIEAEREIMLQAHFFFGVQLRKSASINYLVKMLLGTKSP